MKRYIAILNQNGQDAPVATVLENSLGPIVWTRAVKGEYLGTLAGAFPADRTIALIGKGQGGENDTPTSIDLPASSEDYVVVSTKDLSISNPSCNTEDGLLVRTSVIIMVY